MIGSKHLIQCHCVLPQYRKLDNPIFHKFVVYSKHNTAGEIITKLSKCNNCDALHRIVDLCKSEIVIRMEDTDVVVDIDDIKLGLSDKLIKILDKNNCDHPTYEQIDHIFESELWGEDVVIGRKTINNLKTHLKILNIKSENSFRIRSEVIDLSVGTNI